ncbi:MAG: SGNH/GDSL hydrolase family protein [Planctomycetes bacterium]|nr:SGNH/GDSL hydrolase family protein [Planctomycetota bacterium]
MSCSNITSVGTPTTSLSPAWHRRPLSKRLTFRVVTCCAALIFTVALIEATLRVLTPAPAFSASLNLHMNLDTVLEPDLHGVATPVRFTTNRWGMRGSTPPVGPAWDEATTIVAIGGSTTQCFFLDDSRTWPAVLEKELRSTGHNVWVGNAGQAGHSTIGHVAMVDGPIAQIRPDYVLFLVGVNDLSVSLRPQWRWDESMSESLLGQARSAGLNWLLDHSRLAYRLHLAKQVHFDGSTVRSKDFSIALPTEPATGDEYRPALGDDGILTSLPLFRRNVVSLIEVVRSFGATPVFLTQPLLIEDSPQWANVRARSSWMKKQKVHLTGDGYARLLDRFNDVLLDICAQRNVPCLDLAGIVPHSTDYYYDLVHYNDAGAKLVGEAVGAYFRAHVLPAPKATS